jgi:hypothetical protein
VNIALTKEFLVNAFYHNFDIGVLVSGDDNYVDLVNEVKRWGLRIHGSFFKDAARESFRDAFDSFYPMPNIQETLHLNNAYLQLATELLV